jgi:hypothetical protein
MRHHPGRRRHPRERSRRRRIYNALFVSYIIFITADVRTGSVAGMRVLRRIMADVALAW